MNKKDALKSLAGLLESFICHRRLINELMGIVSGSGIELRFFELLLTRLQFLSKHGRFASSSQGHKEFECINDTISSMHLAGNGFNVRILYAFLSDEAPVLLLAFYEREGKRKTNYSTYITPATERLKEMENEDNEQE